MASGKKTYTELLEKGVVNPVRSAIDDFGIRTSLHSWLLLSVGNQKK